MLSQGCADRILLYLLHIDTFCDIGVGWIGRVSMATRHSSIRSEHLFNCGVLINGSQDDVQLSLPENNDASGWQLLFRVRQKSQHTLGQRRCLNFRLQC